MTRWKPMKFYMELKRSIVREYERLAECKTVTSKELEDIINSVFVRQLAQIEDGEQA